jgi:hypothetical protein
MDVGCARRSLRCWPPELVSGVGNGGTGVGVQSVKWAGVEGESYAGDPAAFPDRDDFEDGSGEWRVTSGEKKKRIPRYARNDNVWGATMFCVA